MKNTIIKLLKGILKLNRKMKLIIFLSLLLFGLTKYYFSVNSNSLTPRIVDFNSPTEKYEFQNVNILIEKGEVMDWMKIKGSFIIKDSIFNNKFSIAYTEDMNYQSSNLKISDNQDNVRIPKKKLLAFDHNASYLDTVNFEFIFNDEFFNKSGSEINNYFKFSFGQIGRYAYPKLNVSFFGLAEYNLTTFPDISDWHSLNYFTFDFSKVASIENSNPRIDIYPQYSEKILINGENRERKYSVQNFGFILGMLIGAIFSGIIELVIELFREKETRKANKG